MHNQSMELRQIEAFVKVVRCNTFTQAAEELSLTQPAVTRSVATLEAELKTKLLDRMGRTVKLTASGQIFLTYAESILQKSEDAIRNVNDVSAGISGRLRLASSGTIATYLLPKAIRNFRLAYPSVNLELHTSPSTIVFEMVMSGEVDFGLVMDTRPDPALSIHEISKYRHVLLTSSDHPICKSLKSKSVSPREFETYPTITMESGSTLRRHAETIMESDGANLKLGLIVDNVETIKRMVREGLGVAILPDLSVQQEALSRDFAVYPISNVEGVEQSIAAIYRNDRYTPTSMHKMIDLLSS